MYVIDASSIVHAWDNYPVGIFPRLWIWIAEQLALQELVIARVAFGEVGHVSPDCHEWLTNNHIHVIEMTPAMLADALRFKIDLNIEGESYHPNGVDENDLFVIACASQMRYALISNEAVQNVPPQLRAKYKIPAVCQYVANQQCIDFIRYLGLSGSVF